MALPVLGNVPKTGTRIDLDRENVVDLINMVAVLDPAMPIILGEHRFTLHSTGWLSETGRAGMTIVEMVEFARG